MKLNLGWRMLLTCPFTGISLALIIAQDMETACRQLERLVAQNLDLALHARRDLQYYHFELRCHRSRLRGGSFGMNGYFTPAENASTLIVGRYTPDFGLRNWVMILLVLGLVSTLTIAAELVDWTAVTLSLFGGGVAALLNQMVNYQRNLRRLAVILMGGPLKGKEKTGC